MPYIQEKDRSHVSAGNILNAGELNYFITKTIINYLGKDYNYNSLNEVVGVLEACKLEFYRRMVSPYENHKIKLNGDVYDRSK